MALRDNVNTSALSSMTASTLQNYGFCFDNMVSSGFLQESFEILYTHAHACVHILSSSGDHSNGHFCLNKIEITSHLNDYISSEQNHLPDSFCLYRIYF